MKSLRRALESQGIKSCPSGLLGLANFYKSSAQARRCFGFKALSQIIFALQWPTGFVALEDYPKDDSQGWEDDPQGIAHDDVTWFFTRADALLTIPVSTGLQGLSNDHFDKRHASVALGNGETYSLASNEPGGADTDIIQIDPMAGFDHLGALTIQPLGSQSVLYIPVQDQTGVNKPIIYALQSISGKSLIDHNWKAVIPRTGDQGSWCAFDSVGGHLYSSDFFDSGAPPGSSVDVYSVGTPAQADAGSPEVGQPMVLTFVGSINLFESDGVTPASLSRLQGGFITPSRHLYLVQDDGTGIVGFDLVTCRKRITIPVDYQHKQGIANATYQEIEGACLFSNPPAPGMSGDIHVLLYENGWGPIGMDFWIKHFGVVNPSDRFVI